MVNEEYKSFVEICRKDGTYTDKKANLLLRIKKGAVLSKGRNGKWEERVTPINYPNKKRFLRYSDNQARRL